jgi:hypothetical protein
MSPRARVAQLRVVQHMPVPDIVLVDCAVYPAVPLEDRFERHQTINVSRETGPAASAGLSMKLRSRNIPCAEASALLTCDDDRQCCRGHAFHAPVHPRWPRWRASIFASFLTDRELEVKSSEAGSNVLFSRSGGRRPLAIEIDRILAH